MKEMKKKGNKVGETKIYWCFACVYVNEFAGPPYGAVSVAQKTEFLDVLHVIFNLSVLEYLQRFGGH